MVKSEHHDWENGVEMDYELGRTKSGRVVTYRDAVVADTQLMRTFFTLKYMLFLMEFWAVPASMINAYVHIYDGGLPNYYMPQKQGRRDDEPHSPHSLQQPLSHLIHVYDMFAFGPLVNGSTAESGVDMLAWPFEEDPDEEVIDPGELDDLARQADPLRPGGDEPKSRLHDEAYYREMFASAFRAAPIPPEAYAMETLKELEELGHHSDAYNAAQAASTKQAAEAAGGDTHEGKKGPAPFPIYNPRKDTNLYRRRKLLRKHIVRAIRDAVKATGLRECAGAVELGQCLGLGLGQLFGKAPLYPRAVIYNASGPNTLDITALGYNGAPPIICSPLMSLQAVSGRITVAREK